MYVYNCFLPRLIRYSAEVLLQLLILGKIDFYLALQGGLSTSARAAAVTTNRIWVLFSIFVTNKRVHRPMSGDILDC